MPAGRISSGTLVIYERPLSPPGEGLVADEPYLELSTVVFRDGPTLTAVARMGRHEIARVEGVDLGDVLESLARAIARSLK